MIDITFLEGGGFTFFKRNNITILKGYGLVFEVEGFVFSGSGAEAKREVLLALKDAEFFYAFGYCIFECIGERICTK